MTRPLGHTSQAAVAGPAQRFVGPAWRRRAIVGEDGRVRPATEILVESVLQPGELPLVLRLGTIQGTSNWFIVVLSDPAHPLLADHEGVAVLIRRARYTEAKARALFVRVERAIERANISALRKACRPQERNDEFLCWAFGLTSLAEALEMKEINDVAMGLARSRDRGELDTETFLSLIDQATTAIRARRALSPSGSGGTRGTA